MSSELRVYTENGEYKDGMYQYMTIETLEHFVAECALRKIPKDARIRLTREAKSNSTLQMERLYAGCAPD